MGDTHWVYLEFATEKRFAPAALLVTWGRNGHKYSLKAAIMDQSDL
ncbi:hypothetical protein PF008_g27099 [Phytophthora fragariae]|uniref:Uncharacterized protein n=1 Tax=Phytophthora fragariae TaxID=53985 RepID=A0A6G0QF44_9STRA|nr:hypothetical protein PF003_g27664 [Phytophthora fragariae]KAE9284683.1 hypothetical protein PF008_g27099 [Phytophthora fragariae]